MIYSVRFLVFVSLIACFNDVLTYPYAGGNYNQWSNPMGQQQHQGFGGSGGQRGFGMGSNFGQGGGYSQTRGGQQQWQSTGYNNGQGAEAYKTNVFNEPDRYGYDYTIPGATVHYLMYKKQGNRGSGNYGVDESGWNKNY